MRDQKPITACAPLSAKTQTDGMGAADDGRGYVVGSKCAANNPNTMRCAER